MEDQTLVALSPGDLPATQSGLIDWCTGKIASLEKEADEFNDHMMIATANGWKLSAVRSALNRTARRITYYAKMKAAVEAGFLIVPNFPVRVLAVRVDRKTSGVKGSSTYAHNYRVSADLLPAGAGHYVDSEVGYVDVSHQESDGKGGMTRVSEYIPTSDFDEPDFPMLAVKPAVMQRTAHAMALKVFDEIGIVESAAPGDPIMVGRLRDPRGGGRVATFFLAWWLDPETL